MTSAVWLCVAMWTATETAPPASPLRDREKFLTPQVEEAIDRGLAFLAAQRRQDGSITDQSHPVGATSIAILAFLANGHLPGKGEYGRLVADAVEFLLNRQDRSSGMIGSSMYEHGFALLALADVWGENKADADRLQDGIEKAVALALLSQSQNPSKAWRYRPTDHDHDLSVSSAVLQGLRAAREAFFEVPQQAMDWAAGYWLRCANPDGGFSYLPGRHDSNVARTGIGVMGLLACGRSQRPEIAKAIAYLKKAPSQMDGYAAYYAVLAMYQARTLMGEEAWDTWYPKVQAALLKTQHRDGSFGSGRAGLVVETGLHVIALSVQKGLLPLFQR